MSSSVWRDRVAQPRFRASFFQFVLYMSAGVMAPYQAIWMSEKGIDKGDIGLINAAPFVIIILLNFSVGRLADRAKDWRQVIIVGAIVGGFASFAMLLAVDFWSILIAVTLVLVPFQLILPITDSATMRMSRRLGFEFGHVRVWGTFGFVSVTLATGLLIDRFGFKYFVPLIIVACVVRALVALQLPFFRGGSGNDAVAKTESLLPDVKRHPLVSSNLRGIFQPWFLLPLIGTGMLHGSHMMQLSMGALIWKEAGIPEAMIGAVWAIAPASEILMLLYFSKLAKRFSARHLLLMGAGAACLRWTGLGLQPDVWGIVILQAMNMLTFGMTYLGIVNFIANWTTDEISAQAQSIFSMIRQVFIIFGLAGFGALAGMIGAGSYFVAGGMAAVGGGMILISLAIMSPKNESSD